MADRGYALATDAAGNVYVTGYTRGNLARTNSGRQGRLRRQARPGGDAQLWLQQFGSPGEDKAWGVAVTGDGIRLGGMTSGALGTAVGALDGWVARYDAAGNRAWLTQFGTTANEEVWGLTADAAGNTYVAAYSAGDFDGPLAGDKDLVAARFDAAGTLTWKDQLGTDLNDKSAAVGLDGAGNLYVAGFSDGDLEGHLGKFDGVLVKYAPDTTREWVRQFGTTEDDGADVFAEANLYLDRPEAAGLRLRADARGRRGREPARARRRLPRDLRRRGHERLRRGVGRAAARGPAHTSATCPALSSRRRLGAGTARGRMKRGLQQNDTAPDFEADSTEGKIRFHDWIGDSWAVLFSHPKDFTPVCTTELGYMAKIKPEFDRRNVKIIGLSVDPTGDHEGWARDIEETQGHAPNYPIIADADFNGLEALRDAAGEHVRRPEAAHAGRQPDRPQRLRHRPGQEDQADPRLSDDDRPQLRRGAAGDRLAPADGRAPGRDAGELEAGRGRDHRRLGLGRGGEEDLPGRLGVAQAVHPHRPAASGLSCGGMEERHEPLLTKDGEGAKGGGGGGERRGAAGPAARARGAPPAHPRSRPRRRAAGGRRRAHGAGGQGGPTRRAAGEPAAARGPRGGGGAPVARPRPPAGGGGRAEGDEPVVVGAAALGDGRCPAASAVASSRKKSSV